MTSGRLAIATSWFVAPRQNSFTSWQSSCGLVKWCYSAAALAKMPYLDAEVAILTNNATRVRTECHADPPPRIIPYSQSFMDVVKRWQRAMHNRTYRRPVRDGLQNLPFSMATLGKWEAFARTEYRAILLTDVDMDIFFSTSGQPPAPGTGAAALLERAWTISYPAFLASRYQLVAQGDASAPVVTAVQLLKPSAATYARGVQTLRTLRWSGRGGFNETGPPQSLFNLSLLPQHHAKAITRSGWWRKNDWHVVTGDGDQGLFTHVLLVQMQAIDFPRRSKNRTWTVNHFHAATKPWKAHTTCRRYFEFLDLADFHHPPSPCLELLQAKQRCLAPKPSKQTCARCRRERLATTGCHGVKPKPHGDEPKTTCGSSVWRVFTADGGH